MTGYHRYKLCIEACLTCASLCQYCASSSLKEENAVMADCIKLQMECAAICYATAQLMRLNSSRVTEMARICAAVCDACAEECAKHSPDHCIECADACVECADACELLM